MTTLTKYFDRLSTIVIVVALTSSALSAQQEGVRTGSWASQPVPRTASTIPTIPIIQKDRLADWIGPMERVKLDGSVHPLAQPQFDQGLASPDLKLSLITLMLKKTPEQQADLDQLLNGLQDRTSPLYHQWLTPEQYADRFGVSQNDIDKIAAWLEAGAFQVQLVSRGRDHIVFSGTAGQVEQALHTQIHRYMVNGEQHFANAAAPEIPQVLADLVIGFRGLHDFMPKPSPRRSLASSRRVAGAGPRPDAVDSNSGITYLAPDDLAAIYNVNALYSLGWYGSGQRIAIAGGSDIDASDIEAFQKLFNLPVHDPQQILATPSPDPRKDPDGMGEADLDIEWSGAIARNAQIWYVYSVDPFYSAVFAIDNVVAPVLSTSFGLCELRFMADDVASLHEESRKAASLGITWVASSGDSGAAGCEDQNGPLAFATTRMSVPIPASLPEVTSVGGTEFNEGNGSYWSSTVGPSLGTAFGYIPEQAWNDENRILQALAQAPFPIIKTMGGGGFAAGGGGVSVWFGKPQWQTGPGVPNDGARDVPDVALTASNFHDPYFVFTGGQTMLVGGTSASAPVFAGMVALLNQYLVGTGVQSQPGLGNMNPMLYYLAQYNGVFHDITVGGNQVPCMPGSTQDCPASGVYGYSAGPGYDLATGLGSVNADLLIGTWAYVVTHTP